MIKIRNIAQKHINSVIRGLRNIEKWLDKDNQTENKYGYEKLSPKTDIENKYFEEIEWAIENKEITNIALGGPYGAGKSSIIKSYMDKRREHKYLNISLAYFSNGQGEDTSTNNIEENILKQMFYRVKHNKVPYSRYKRIKNIKFKSRLWIFSLVAISMFSGVNIFNPKFTKSIIGNINVINDTYESFNLGYLYVGLFIATTFILIIKFIHFINTSIKLTKISTTVSKSTIELGASDEDKSIFNKNIDEILYFFEVNKYNIVIFEDIDRFNNIDIFVRLRELNELINNCEQIKRKVTFIYAIKEDMFEDGKDRTKFFDFIIPIIPVINSSNSIEIINRKLEKFKLDIYLDKNFINDITIYIDDMRILTNIYNEFRIYKEKLYNINLNMNNLFGIIVYKNLYTEDFAKLQFNRGMVADIFKNKNYVDDIIRNLDKQFEKTREDIEFIKNTFINNVDELKSIYLDFLNIDKSQEIYIDGVPYNYKQFKEHILVEGESLERLIRYKEPGYSYRNIKIKDILNSNENRLHYYERLNLITIINDDKIEQLKVELNELKDRKQKIQSMKVKDLIEEYGIENIISENTRKEKLIVYLIRNGYIDEMYNSYLTYFYEGSLTSEDMKFVQSIKNQEILPFNYRIQNIGKIMDRLYISEFERTEILNFDLLNFIIHNLSTYKIYYDAIINQLSNEEDRSKDFIDGYISLNQNINTFIRDIGKKWENIWVFIYKESNYTIEKIDEYLINLMKLLDINDLIKINKENLLSEYISKKEDFLKTSRLINNTEKIKEILKSLRIRFEYIDINEENIELVDYIYENGLYQINYTMIRLILEHYSNNIDIEKLKTSNYTTIKESKCQKLIEYIDLNIEFYIEHVFLNLDRNSNESEKYCIELLGREEISEENKHNIIDKESVKINEINKVNKNLWRRLFIRERVIANWLNIALYLSLDKLDKKMIIEFLNDVENYIKLSNECINKENYIIGQAYIESLCRQLFLELDISYKSFQSIAIKIKEICDIYIDKEYFNNFIRQNISGIERYKLSVLIDLYLIELTKENYEYIRENISSKYIKLIENNIEKYINDYQNYSLNSEDISTLLKSKMISKLEKDFIIDNLNLVDILEDGIYDNLNFELASYIVKTNKEVNIPLLNHFLNSEIDKYDKIAILSKSINKLNNDNISIGLKKVGDEYSDITEKGKIPLLKNNLANISLIKELADKGYIDSYITEGNQIKINKREA